MIKKVFPILALSIFSSMLGAGIIAPLLPLYAESMGASGIWIGMIFTGFSLSRAIFIPLIGRLSDRKGRKAFLCAGLLFYAVISLGYIWADSLLQLTLVRLIQGVAAAMILPIVQAYVGDVSPEGEEGKWMGYFNAAFFAGFGLGPLMGGTLTDHFGMTVAFSTMGGLNLLAFLIAVFLLPEVKGKASLQISLKDMAASPMTRGLFTFRLTFAGGMGALFTFLPILATIYLGLSASQTGLLLALIILLMSLFLPFSGRIADRFNRRTLVVIGSFINVAFFTLIPLAHDFWQISVICVVGALGGGIAMPAASALAVEEGRKFGMGTTIALFTLGMSIGQAVSPLLAGVIADLVNINWVFYLGAFTALMGVALFIWFTRSYQNQNHLALK